MLYAHFTWVGIIFVTIFITSVNEVENVDKCNVYPCLNEHRAWYDRII